MSNSNYSNETQALASPLKKFNLVIKDVRTQDYLNAVLHEKKNSFVNNVTALVASNALLQQCNPMSVIYAAMKATALDLPLDSNLGCAYVIPYRNNKTGVTEAQFQLGYKGFIQLALRSGQFAKINATDVKEGELSNYNLLTGDFSLTAAQDRANKKTVGYAAFFKLINGFSKSLYMTVEEVEKHAKRYSKTYGSSNDYTRKNSKWTTDFDAMAKKTVLKMLLSKNAPLSVENIYAAIQADQRVFDGSSEDGAYVDNPETVDEQASVDATKEKVKAARQRVKDMEARKAQDGEETAPEDLIDADTGDPEPNFDFDDIPAADAGNEPANNNSES